MFNFEVICFFPFLYIPMIQMIHGDPWSLRNFLMELGALCHGTTPLLLSKPSISVRSWFTVCSRSSFPPGGCDCWIMLDPDIGDDMWWPWWPITTHSNLRTYKRYWHYRRKHEKNALQFFGDPASCLTYITSSGLNTPIVNENRREKKKKKKKRRKKEKM